MHLGLDLPKLFQGRVGFGSYARVLIFISKVIKFSIIFEARAVIFEARTVIFEARGAIWTISGLL